MSLGLLQYGASTWTSLSKNARVPYPTEGLQVLLTMRTYEDGGTTYYVNTEGTDIPVALQDGGEDVLDFSVLNDDRFDKGARVGNALSLPEYYNDPLDAYFYYDDTSQTTRRYWKLKDFHYFYIQQQTDITPRLLNNWCFLKAKATTDTSNVIDSVQGLYIYSTDYTHTICQSAGTIYKANTQAYGLVFDGILNEKGTTIIIQFINDNEYIYTHPSSGYLLSTYDRRISLYKNVSGTLTSRFRTVPDYISDNVDYRLLVFRNESENQYVTGGVGTFAVYIQGKNKDITTTVYTEPNTDEMELVDVTGGSGSNPVTDNTYTTNAFTVIDSDSDDTFKSVYLGGDLQKFDTWTEGTGDYVQVLNGEQTGSNLTKLKAHIGIQADFYGDERLLTFDFTNGWTQYRIQDVTANSFKVASGQTNGGLYKVLLESGALYSMTFTFTNGTGALYLYNDSGSTILLSNIVSGQENEVTISEGDNNLNIRYVAAALSQIIFSKIEIMQKFVNYYSS